MMKRVLPFMLLGLVACAPMTTTLSGEPTRTSMYSRYDRIQGRTEVSTLLFIRVPFMGVGPSVELTLLGSYPDSVLAAPLDAVVMAFKASGGTRTEGWSFLRENDLNLLLDDRVRLSFKGTHDGEVGAGLLKEYMGFAVPTEDFLRIGSATKVEGRLGQWSFALKPDEIAKLREMALFAAMAPEAPRPIRARDRS